MGSADIHLESYTPGQDQAKSYVPVCTGTYRYVPVYAASTGILVQYVLVCTAMYQKHDMRVSHTCRQLFESKLKQRTAPMQEKCWDNVCFQKMQCSVNESSY